MASFLLLKSVMSREGTPAVTLHWCATRAWSVDGSASAEGRMRRMSQWIFRAISAGTEIEVGRMIHRITFEMTRGLRGVEERMARKFGMGVARERRYRVQRGIVVVLYRVEV